MPSGPRAPAHLISPLMTGASPAMMTAALLAMAASAILSFVDNFIFLVSQEAGLWQFHVFRTLLAVPMLLIMARLLGLSLKPKNLAATIARSLAVATGLLIYFATLGVLPVAQAAAGLFSAPLWVLILSALIFKVRISLWQLLAMGLGFAGAMALLQPDLQTLSPLSFVPLTAGAFYGLGMLMTWHWCRDETAITLTIGTFAAMGLASMLPLIGLTVLWPVPADATGFVLRGWETPTLIFILITIGQGIGSVIAVSLLTQAYKMAAPSFVAVFEYSFLIFAAFWAFVLWGDGIDALAVLGIAAILVSGTAISLLKKS